MTSQKVHNVAHLVRQCSAGIRCTPGKCTLSAECPCRKDGEERGDDAWKNHVVDCKISWFTSVQPGDILRSERDVVFAN